MGILYCINQLINGIIYLIMAQYIYWQKVFASKSCLYHKNDEKF